MRNERGSDVIVCIVGNKNDLTDQRTISLEMAVQKAKELETLCKNLL